MLLILIVFDWLAPTFLNKHVSDMC